MVWFFSLFCFSGIFYSGQPWRADPLWGAGWIIFRLSQKQLSCALILELNILMVSAGMKQLSLIPAVIWCFFMYTKQIAVSCWFKKQNKNLSFSGMALRSGLINLPSFSVRNKRGWIKGTVRCGFLVCFIKPFLKGCDYSHSWWGKTIMQLGTYPGSLLYFFPLPKHMLILYGMSVCATGCNKAKRQHIRTILWAIPE